MIQLPRSNWILALLMVLAATLGAATLRAAAQSVMTGPAQQPRAAAMPAETPPAGRAAINPPPAQPPSDGAPTPATQPRDVTPPTAPGSDTRGSADNNVSFPVDI